jgi:hypothetical protein
MGGELRLEHDVAGLIEDAHRQQSGMKVDSAVKSVLFGIEAHHGPLWEMGGLPEPGSWSAGTRLPETSTLRQGSPLDLLPHWDRHAARPRGAMNSIKAMKLTGPPFCRSGFQRLTSGPATYLIRSATGGAAMAGHHVRVNHPLFERLRQLDKEAARRFPGRFDPGLGSLGLILDQKLDQSRYSFCTPLNCQTFAHTGGEGVHFSFRLQDGMVRESSPAVVTIPAMGGQNFVVGENLFDFLCLGVHRGFFALEQLAYYPELTLEVFTNPDWQSTESWHGSVGFVPGEEDRRLLAFLTSELGLRPWPNAARFALLQERYCGSLELPTEE